jgi:glutamyl-tRNA reductase
MADVVCIGLSHKTAPLPIRERVALTDAEAGSLVRELAAAEWISEVVALSTCNRTELYAAAERGGEAAEWLTEVLATHTDIEAAELACVRYVHRDADAVAHLFRVASGLDSMVVGETEILGQVRRAWRAATEDGVAGPALEQVFRRALEAGKRARTDTGIAHGPSSVSAVAVDVAREAFSDPGGRRVLLLGAGKMARATAGALDEIGFGEIVVVNRSIGAARELADRVGGRGVPFDRMPAELRTADIVISSTAAPHQILSARDFEVAMEGRAEGRLVVLDISVPRDIDPWVGQIPGVELTDIDDLERVVEASLNGRLAEAAKATLIVEDAVSSFESWRRERAAAPAIANLRAEAERIRQAELSRVAGQWESASEADRERVDALTKAIVNKLLHEPSVRARAAASDDDGLRHLESLRHLFGLEAPVDH